MQPDLTTLLARLEAATDRDAALEADLVAVLRPMIPEQFRGMRLQPASWMSVLDVMALHPDLTHEDAQAILGDARGDGVPGYVLAAALLRHLIAREGGA